MKFKKQSDFVIYLATVLIITFQIQDFAKKNNMNIVYYFSPMSLSTKNKDYVTKLQGKIPKLQDFSSVVKANACNSLPILPFKDAYTI